ncbi:hypothetical protein MC7420_2794 [Coleofasciculus chthonoplastes PCC 7420]|uniref:Uncharacterized protein n=1 Tax=Coleofasciculus chthonoplastes PCC 7420 TaxID=118168 RepID=B4W3M6_9CYAN|nr:hypothetical protein MC7420_2794 [Coleofasciculus chthonoplastes PCC 7420]
MVKPAPTKDVSSERLSSPSFPSSPSPTSVRYRTDEYSSLCNA